MYRHKTFNKSLKNSFALLQELSADLISPCQRLSEIILWLRGRCLILGSESFHWELGLWSSRFTSLGISFSAYTLQWFSEPGSVYTMLAKGHLKSYIGSTTLHMFARHTNRKAKVQQLRRGQWISCEIAVRYWAKSLFEAYIPIVYRHVASPLALLAQEHQDIH